jgi:hypothetical protein
LHATYTVGELQNGVADGVIVPVGVGDGVKDAVDVIVGVMLGVKVVEGVIVLLLVMLDVAVKLNVSEVVGVGEDVALDVSELLTVAVLEILDEVGGLVIIGEVERVVNCAIAGFESTDLGRPMARPTPSETASAMTAAIARRIETVAREGPTTIEARALAGPDATEGSRVGCAMDGRRVFCAEPCPGDDAAVIMGLIMTEEGRRNLLDAESAMASARRSRRKTLIVHWRFISEIHQ